MNWNGMNEPRDARVLRARALCDQLLHRKRRVALARLHYGRGLLEARRDRIWALDGFQTWEAYLENLTFGGVKEGQECIRQYQEWMAVNGPELPVLEPAPEPECEASVVPHRPEGGQPELFPADPTKYSSPQSMFDGLTRTR